jgi:hypothetical protein
VRMGPRLVGKDAPSRTSVAACGAGGGWVYRRRPGPVADCSGAILEVRSSDGGAGCG